MHSRPCKGNRRVAARRDVEANGAAKRDRNEDQEHKRLPDFVSGHHVSRTEPKNDLDGSRDHVEQNSLKGVETEAGFASIRIDTRQVHQGSNPPLDDKRTKSAYPSGCDCFWQDYSDEHERFWVHEGFGNLPPLEALGREL
jgi:hypothetical protein